MRVIAMLQESSTTAPCVTPVGSSPSSGSGGNAQSAPTMTSAPPVTMVTNTICATGSTASPPRVVRGECGFPPCGLHSLTLFPLWMRELLWTVSDPACNIFFSYGLCCAATGTTGFQWDTAQIGGADQFASLVGVCQQSKCKLP